MILEEALKTKKFVDQYHRAVLNILYSSAQIRRMHNHVLKQYDLTIPQYNVLRILRGSHPQPCTVRMIAERMIEENSNASRVVDKLKVKGLVSRFISELDRRLVDINITDKGLELLKEIDGIEDLFGCNIYKALSQEEIVQLNTLIDKFTVSLPHPAEGCEESDNLC